MEINGKIYRNLEGQVAYLTEKWDDLQDQINDVKGKLTHYIVVEELPTEDIDTSAVYLVGPKGTEPDTYYEEWVYVQLEDESWTWEKLGDTDSVDLSGYLQKVTTVTTYPQAYYKKADGTQDTYNMSYNAVDGTIMLRSSNGQVMLPNQGTYTPADDQAISKRFANNTYVAKATGTSTYGQAYVKAADGSQTRYDISVAANAHSIPYRDEGGRVKTKDPVNSEDSVNLSYANSNYVLQDKGGATSYHHIYCKNPDGSQGWINGTLTPVANAVPIYRSSGTLRVGTPTDNADAATKAYVDATVGQLMYLHDIDLAITIDSTNKLYVKGYLVNGSSTAITSFDRIVYKQLDVQWGGFGPSSDNATPAAITKMPDSFRQDDFEEPLVGFLYQYFSGGNLVSNRTTSSMTTTITDVVTTW